MTTRAQLPLAIVGRACILPGALTPRALGELALEGKDVVSEVPAGRFRIDPSLVRGTPSASLDRTWSTRGGYVRGFGLDRAGLDLDALAGHEPTVDGALGANGADVEGLDPLFHWVLSAGRDALLDAGFDTPLRGVRAGAVIGNLSFPTESMTLLGEQRALGHGLCTQLGPPWSQPVDARNAFMSGLPALMLARALHLDARLGAFALDAACASSLYAIRLAALALEDGRADVMLAGAVNRADSLFLHVGFCALQALSASGTSRPFDVRADGLLPAEGCGLVALMRLDDAVAQGKRIHGVIRGVGLSNDGRSKNLLAPASEGQVRAIRAAWDAARLEPTSADLLECHATGTQMGDRTELESITAVFTQGRGHREGASTLPLGSLKSNLGHLITAAGVAGLLKVTEAMALEELPPSLYVDEPIEGLRDGDGLRVQRERAPWPAVAGRPRRAGVSAFGFGGNNAHLVLDQYQPARIKVTVPDFVASDAIESTILAVVAAAERSGASEVALEGLRFPPNDLKEALPQQLLVFEAARAAVRSLPAAAAPDDVLPRFATGVFIGMSTDLRVTTPGLRWRAPEIAARLAPFLDSADAATFVTALRDAAMAPMNAQAVLGCMPNIPANRLNVQLDARGPGFTVSAEGSSGARALEVARALIAAGDIESAVVGDVDADVDRASVLVVMSAARARALRLPVLALLSEGDDPRTAAKRIHDISERAPAWFACGATTKAALIAALSAPATAPDDVALAAGPWRAAVTARGGEAALASQCQRLAQLLQTHERVDEDGLWARAAAAVPREQVALLFGTATTLPPDVNRELSQAFPGLDGDLPRAPGGRPCLDDLVTASSSMQLGARLVRDVLGVPVGKALGVSLGESNALFAAGAWSDGPRMFEEMESSRIFDDVLFGDGALAWRAALVRAAPAHAASFLDDVTAACASERCAVLVVHTPDEAEIGGEPAAVDAVLRALGPKLAGQVALPTMPVVHCALLAPHADQYRALHRRQITAVDVTIYSHARRGPMTLTTETVADDLLAQALATVDFPALLTRVVDDGARLILDVSPRGLAGSWATRTLAHRGLGAVDVISLGHDLPSLFSAAARLAVAGVPITPERLRALRTRSAPRGASLHVPLPRAPGPFPAAPPLRVERMSAPPWLPPILPGAPSPAAPVRLPDEPVTRRASQPQPRPAVGRADTSTMIQTTADGDGLAGIVLAQREGALEAQRALFEAMGDGHRAFLAHREAAARRVLAMAPLSDDLVDGPLVGHERGRGHGLLEHQPEPALLWSRLDLERLASGRISDVWGPVFSVQDGFRRQVRMPEPPLLLADRVLAIDATAGILEKNRSITTETDVRQDSWYLHEGRCPAGVLIETGQADLLLVSYMGVDFENRGDRVYRLLGCDLSYHGRLPLAETTLRHDIHVDGYATAPMKHGDVRIFFFHSDTFGRAGDSDEQPLLSVRNGQAGFFTDAELAGSGGILWSPADVPTASLATYPLAAPPRPTRKRTLSKEDVAAFSHGDAFTCFGLGFERAASHVRTPRIPEGRLLLVDRVAELDFAGGPWGRGYLRAELDLASVERAASDGAVPWFLKGHFKDDPCMPGTLMFEGCLEALAIYLAAAGVTLERDGFVFEPATERAFKLRCRGQATPSSRKLVYEVFVRSLSDGAEPSVIADILVTVDGLKALHCESVELVLRPDFPITSRPELLGAAVKPSGWDAVGGVDADADTDAVFDQRSLLATGIGRPSDAFPGLYEPFDSGRKVPRLPGPPYHFMSRVMHVDGPAMGSLARNESAAGTSAVVEYDVPPDAWYFGATDGCQGGAMPFAVLLEIALQPCGWVSSYVGSALTTELDLSYRNLDGAARLHREVTRDIGTLSVRATLTKSSASSGMIIQELSFAVTTRDGAPIFDGTTVFGFFPPEALARQVGISASPEERARIAERTASFVDLRTRPARYCAGPLALPSPMLTMIDRVCSYGPASSPAGLSRTRTEKGIDPAEWFFKAHFFQDPVQPGSLGVEAMVQALMWTAIHEERHRGMVRPRFQSLATGEPVVWKYRGQVVPSNLVVTAEVDLVAVEEDRASGAVTLRADGALWVDGTKIYAARGLALRIVDDA